MFTMQLDAANNLVSIAGSLFVLGSGFLALIFFFFQLRSDNRSNRKEIERLEKDLENAKSDITKRHDGIESKMDNLQHSLATILTGLGRVEGKMDMIGTGR